MVSLKPLTCFSIDVQLLFTSRFLSFTTGHRVLLFLIAMLFPGNAVAFPRDIDQNDPGRGPLIMAITWIFQIATFAAVMARVAVRRHKQVRLGWDDYLMLLALVSTKSC